MAQLRVLPAQSTDLREKPLDIGFEVFLMNPHLPANPVIDLLGKSDDHVTGTIGRPVHREAEVCLPALDGAHSLPHVLSNVFPRRQDTGHKKEVSV